MNIKDLAARVIAAHPKVSPAVASQIIRTTLQTIRQELEAAPDGNVPVAFLGSFRVKNVEVERNGEKTQLRRTLFVAQRPRPVADATLDAALSADGDADGELVDVSADSANDSVPATAGAPARARR